MAPRHRVLYDADCGFCRWSLGWILRWDRRLRLEPLALQDPAAARLLPGMDEDARMASWHLVAPDGTVTSGGRAAIPMLRLLPGGVAVASVAARVPGLLERGYGWVNRNRGALGRPLTRGAKARADRIIVSREATPAGRGASTIDQHGNETRRHR
jgi:predicted DCC family thiol-disulfide oxidoreductase YuxK